MFSRRLLVGLSSAAFLAASTATPSSAAATLVSAHFPQERTFARPCPPGIQPPPASFCYTGSDHSGLGIAVPGGSATEDFAGYVDFTKPIPNACPVTVMFPSGNGYPDHNVVTIGTPEGRLFLTTDGIDCMGTGQDNGTWRIIGGTGIFEHASGSGSVHTQAYAGDGSLANPIRSDSVYTTP